MANPAARGVVFDEPCRIELFRECDHFGDPILRFWKVLPLFSTRGVRAAGSEESPSLVERHPREDRRVVVVAPNHLTERVLNL